MSRDTAEPGLVSSRRPGQARKRPAALANENWASITTSQSPNSVPAAAISWSCRSASPRCRAARAFGTLRERMSSTINQLEQKLNLTQVVKDHPWPALAMAVGAGVLLSGSRGDVKATGATGLVPGTHRRSNRE